MEWPPKQQEKPMKVYLYNNELRKPPKITNSTSTDTSFGSAQSSELIAEQQGYYSIAPADKLINE